MKSKPRGKNPHTISASNLLMEKENREYKNKNTHIIDTPRLGKTLRWRGDGKDDRLDGRKTSKQWPEALGGRRRRAVSSIVPGSEGNREKTRNS